MTVSSKPTDASAGRTKPSTNGHVEARSRPVSVMKAKSGLGSLPSRISAAIAPLCVPPPQLQTSVCIPSPSASPAPPPPPAAVNPVHDHVIPAALRARRPLRQPPVADAPHLHRLPAQRRGQLPAR